MMNNFLASHREKGQKNESIRTNDFLNQILNSYQSLGGHLRAPQGMPQNSPSRNNFIQGKYHENKIVAAKTQSTVPFASSSNNNASLIAGTRYGGMSPLALPSDASKHMGSYSINLSLPSHGDSVKKFSFNSLGLQGYANGFQNHSNTTFQKQKNFPYLLNGANSPRPSHNMNNSSILNLLNPHPRVDMNSFPREKDIDKPGGLLHPAQSMTIDPLNPFGNLKDLTRERAMKRPLCEVQETDISNILSASKRPRMSFSTPPNCYEGMQSQIGELLLFKNCENPFSTSEITNDAQENDEENLDLSLHL